ncbi:MAG: archaeosortase/exosortase family protein [Methylovulum sp.]|nr:archaeosortase/exosortase family protein [Methylovulum sp.]
MTAPLIATRIPMLSGFLIRFASWAALGFGMLATEAGGHFSHGLGEFLAQLVWQAVSVFDARADVYGAQLGLGGSFTLEVVESCSALPLVCVLCAAILAYPSSWPAKITGLALACISIQAFNIMRLIALLYLGQTLDPLSFNFIHLYVGTWGLNIAVLGMFLLWLAVISPPFPTTIFRQFGIAFVVRLLLWGVPAMVLWWLLLDPVLMPLLGRVDDGLLQATFKRVHASLNWRDLSAWDINTQILMPDQVPGRLRTWGAHFGDATSITLVLPLVWLLLGAIPHRRPLNLLASTLIIYALLACVLWLGLCKTLTGVLLTDGANKVFISANMSAALSPPPRWLPVLLAWSYSCAVYALALAVPVLLAYQLNKSWWQKAWGISG